MSSSGMVRKQFYLTAQQNSRLQRAAKELQRSEAALLREAINRYLRGPSLKVDLEPDSLFRLVGIASSDDADLSERVDEVLYGTPRE